MTAQERSLDEFFQWQRERSGPGLVGQYALSAAHWLSPACGVFLADVQARGTDTENYGWARIYVAEFSGGLLASIRQFEDEGAAFAYAEERIRVPASRQRFSNRASDVGLLIAGMRAHDLGNC